jgi:hypothetical protein
LARSSQEFLIDQVVWSKDNILPGEYAVLIGRCGGVPVRKGDVFHAAYRYKLGRYPDEMGEEPVRLDDAAVRLEVAEIQAHNRSLDLLGQGMTGAVFVRGEGLDRLAPGGVVGQPVAVPTGSERVATAPSSTTVTPGV